MLKKKNGKKILSFFFVFRIIVFTALLVFWLHVATLSIVHLILLDLSVSISNFSWKSISRNFYFFCSPESTWQIPVLSFLFFVLGIGNLVTTSWTIPTKISERQNFKLRFTRLDKYFWSHKNRENNPLYKVSTVTQI